MRDGLFRGSGDVSLRAAQYLRMSTDEQDYSTLNQAEAIAGYAAAHNIEVVRTYSDEARSGFWTTGPASNFCSVMWRPAGRISVLFLFTM
jgi:hypothetical protein